MPDFANDCAAASLRGRWAPSSIRDTCVLVVASLLIAATCTSSDAASPSTTAGGPGAEALPRVEETAGEVLLNGQQYPFDASTCSATPDRFVVAGSGTTPDGDSFFVTLQAPDSISLVIGADAETDDPDPDLPWYRSLEPATLRGNGTTVEGTGVVVDSHGSVAEEFMTSIRVTCEDSEG